MIVRGEFEHAVSLVRREDVDAFASRLRRSTGRIFFSGQGRSGLLAQMAAMRFMHLGVATHAVGEPTAPAIRSGDTLVMISGSGRTPTSVEYARTAAREGAAVLLVTQTSDGPVQDLADEIVLVDASETVQFGHTLFEHVSLLFLDSVALALMAELDNGAALMQRNHTNLQ